MNRVFLTVILLLFVGYDGLAQDSLAYYVRQAMENNPSVKSAYEGFYAASSRTDQAGVLPDPTLGIGYFISPVETRVGPQQFRFSLTQMFPWFGTLKSREEQMNSQAEAAFWQFAQKVRVLTQEVRTSYYEIYILGELMELEQKNLELLESIEKLATTRFQSGDGRMTDIFKVQLDEKSSRNTLERLTDQRVAKTDQFYLLLNDSSSTIQIPDTIAVSIPLFNSPDSLNSHPLIRANLAQSEAAVAYAEAARKQSYPSIGVGLDYMIIGKREEMDIPDNGKNAFMPLVTFGLPLWRKKYSSMREEAEATERQYLEAARSEQITLRSRQINTTYRIQRALEEMDVYNQQIGLVQRMITLSETDFANDRAQFDDVLENQEKLLEYQKNLVSSYGELLNALAEYDYLTGENPAIIYEILEYENEN